MPPWVVVGPGDDAAVIEPVRGALEVLTTDALVDGVHFDRRFVPPDAIGHRALAVNLSDLAAMGARPRAALLSLALPGVARGRRRSIGWSMAFSRWPSATAWRSSAATSRDARTAGGRRHRHRQRAPAKMLTRDGARAGDEVYVTGTLGDAATGLLRLQEDVAADRAHREYLRPDPRVRAGHAARAKPGSVELHGPQRWIGGRGAPDRAGLVGGHDS